MRNDRRRWEPLFVLGLLGLLGCAACEPPTATAVLKCPPARASEAIPLQRSELRGTTTVTFQDLRSRINERCEQCHVETQTGGFRYADTRPGLSASAERMAAVLSSGRMPPNDPNPEGSRLLGKILEAWIQAGKPADAFRAPASIEAAPAGSFPRPGGDVAEAMTSLGNCIPDPVSLSRLLQLDLDKDRFFAAATELPKDLSETDVTGFDARQLAKQGVFAYAPTYPLWSDDARKLRMVRVPKGQKITFDPTTKTLQIPPNTRFYKTFFQKVIEADGRKSHRAIETRLIVSRPAVNGVEQALFGTYLWDEAQTTARLWEGTYRDGTPFRDLVFKYTNQVRDGEAHQRTYAIPAKHRCLQCHQGAEGQDFVLGFTALQINRRPQGSGGVTDPVEEDELSQVERLNSYGVLDRVGRQYLPLLETSGGDRLPRNDDELHAQAYMVGNCAHCHNPDGFPVREEPRLRDLNLAAGGIAFQFPLRKNAISAQRVAYVDPLHLDLGDAQASLLYRRVATPVTTVWSDALQTVRMVVPHMPANTAGMDCRAPIVIGQWISSIPVTKRGDPVDADTSQEESRAAYQAADQRRAAFTTGCVPPDDVVNWVTEDLTEPATYLPRRPDWNAWDSREDGTDPFVHPDQIHGMPHLFRDLKVDEEFAQVSRTAVPYGYWLWKKGCQFPDELPSKPGESKPDFFRRSWMMTPTLQPRRPLGEVFFETPGAAIFRAVCSNCHGAEANGNSGNAKALLQLSGGSIRVANLKEGLFGPPQMPGDHLKPFDLPGPNGLSIAPYGAAKYLVWMTSGGTTTKFPPGFESLLGSGDKKFGGNMLTKVSYYCSRLLPSQFWIGELRGDEFELGIPDSKRELWELFCGFRNQAIPSPTHIPPDFDSERWLRTAQLNGGLMMFFFFRDQASRGIFPPGADSCGRVYGATR